MNVLILTDLEGISGVRSIEQMERSSEAYRDACRCLTEELNTAAQECFENGAETVYYLDGHGGGGNVNRERLIPELRELNVQSWLSVMREGNVDCLIELGAHARAGTLRGFLDHTMSSKSWFRYSINGRECGEIGIHSVFCGVFGVPIVLCTGDETVCAQAKEEVPGIRTAAVKIADCRNRCRTYENAREILREGVREALAHAHEIRPANVVFPLRIELTYYRSDMCEEALQRNPQGAIRLDARTLTKTIHKIEAYSDLLF